MCGRGPPSGARAVLQRGSVARHRPSRQAGAHFGQGLGRGWSLCAWGALPSRRSGAFSRCRVLWRGCSTKRGLGGGSGRRYARGWQTFRRAAAVLCQLLSIAGASMRSAQSTDPPDLAATPYDWLRAPTLHHGPDARQTTGGRLHGCWDALRGSRNSLEARGVHPRAAGGRVQAAGAVRQRRVWWARAAHFASASAQWSRTCVAPAGPAQCG